MRIQGRMEFSERTGSRCLGHNCRWSSGSDNHCHLTTYQVGRQRGQALVLIISEAIFNCDILAFDKACVLQTLAKRSQEMRCVVWRFCTEKPDNRHCRLLRTRRKWPRERAAEQTYEMASSHRRPDAQIKSIVSIFTGPPKGVDVRFGSKADMCTATRDVRHGPKAN